MKQTAKKALIFIFLGGIIYLSKENYLLFHSIVELFSIIVAFSIFIIVFNSSYIIEGNFFIFLGIIYGFVGALDLFHMLSYKGMGVFAFEGANLPTQLWVAARYLEAFSFLLAFRLLSKGWFSKKKIILLYLAVTALLITVIFIWPVFPDCYLTELGLTGFKIISEYIIIGMLLMSVWLLRVNKAKFIDNIYSYLLLALTSSIASEFIFIFYIDVYSILNIVGHLFKLVSFYFIYKAIDQVSLRKPYETLFYQLSQNNQKLKAEKNKLQQYIDVADLIVLALDIEGKVKLINEKGCKTLGYSREEIIGNNWFGNFLPAEEKEETEEVFNNMLEGLLNIDYYKNDILTKDGERRTITWHNKVLKNDCGEVKEVLSSGIVVNDQLTGLLDLVSFRERLGIEVESDKEGVSQLVVFALGINEFKFITDSYGHTVSNQLLESFAERLKKIDADKVLARDKEEFYLYIDGIKTEREIIEIGKEILNLVNEYYEIDDKKIYIRASIGVAIYPEGGTESKVLVKNAGLAMHLVKDRQAESIQFYSSSVEKELADKISLRAKLTEALKKKEFVLHYQPFINAGTGQVAGVEALIRWIDPEEGIIPPGKFIPLAEEEGLIIEMGNWVLKEACSQLKEWHKRGYKNLFITVNVSPKQLQSEDFVAQVKEVLEREELPSKYLELEITEQAMMGNINYTKSILRKLKELGVRIAVDDFGTGYSSLSYLRELPLNTLKIDRSFVNELGIDIKSNAIPETIIMMGRILELKIVGEGVETEDQLKFLRKRNCELVQGYLFSRPKKETEVSKLFGKEFKLNL